MADEEIAIVVPHQEVVRKDTPDLETDSGVDNNSESGNSCDLDQKTFFSSAESLDAEEPPFVRNTGSVREKGHGDFEYKTHTNSIAYDAPAEFRCRSEEHEITKAPSIAVLQVAQEDEPENVDSNLDTTHFLPFFQDLWNGKKVSANFDVPMDVKPPWYNQDKFKRGQAFAQKHLFCINYAETLSLFLIFAMKSALNPLIFTGRSDTPYRAFQRYLSTVTRVMSWYEGDPWDESSHARRHLATVRAMHRNVQKKLSEATPEEFRRRTHLGTNGEPVWATARPFLLDDFRSACPVPPPGSCPFTMNEELWVNQLDMAVTQFAFVGLVATYPKQFGIHYATDEDLDGFLHMWRTLGHLLGIEDKYNYCNVGLDGVRKRTLEFLGQVLKPSLRDVTIEWEHMSRCVVQGINFYVPGFSFDVALKYLCTVLKIHVPRLTKSLTLWQSFMFRVVDFTFNVLCRVPGLLPVYNTFMLRSIRRAQDASPQLLSKWENTEFPYMKSKVDKVPVKAV